MSIHQRVSSPEIDTSLPVVDEIMRLLTRIVPAVCCCSSSSIRSSFEFSRIKIGESSHLDQIVSSRAFGARRTFAITTTRLRRPRRSWRIPSWFRLTPYWRHARISTYTASGLYHKGAPSRSSTNASTWHCDSSSRVGWRPPYSGIMHQQPCCFAVSFANHVQWSVRRIQISAPRAREECDVRLERRAPQSGRAFRIRLRFCSSVVSHG